MLLSDKSLSQYSSVHLYSFIVPPISMSESVEGSRDGQQTHVVNSAGARAAISCQQSCEARAIKMHSSFKRAAKATESRKILTLNGWPLSPERTVHFYSRIAVYMTHLSQGEDLHSIDRRH